VTRWSVVEPIEIDFDVDVEHFIICKDGSTRPADTLEKKAIRRDEIRGRIRALIEEKNLSISQLAIELGISVTTVRRVCRTHHLGPYKHNDSTIRKRSSQVPFGWRVVGEMLVEESSEQAWILKMKEMLDSGRSLRSIARYLDQLGIPAKNGGRWHAKTVSQILKKMR